MAIPFEPTREEVLAVLDYNPETGILVWRERTEEMSWWSVHTYTRARALKAWNGRNAGKVAGCMSTTGHLTVRFSAKRSIKAHRLAWLIHYGEWPRGILDHKNGIRDDNRISNLREADKSQNGANSKLYSSNTSGYKGVHYMKDRRANPWYASIAYEGKQKGLGHHPTAESAYQAYCAAAHEIHGEFARPEKRDQ